MGIDLKKGFIKKNEKTTRLITMLLIGILLLVVVMPVKTKDSALDISADTPNVDKVVVENREKAYEERLTSILEKSYGQGNIDVMINLAKDCENSGIYYDSSNEKYVVDGVLIVANVGDVNAISDITLSVCALFNLPAHKVAVITRN